MGRCPKSCFRHRHALERVPPPMISRRTLRQHKDTHADPRSPNDTHPPAGCTFFMLGKLVTTVFGGSVRFSRDSAATVYCMRWPPRSTATADGTPGSGSTSWTIPLRRSRRSSFLRSFSSCSWAAVLTTKPWLCPPAPASTSRQNQ